MVQSLKKTNVYVSTRLHRFTGMLHFKS